ncbi:MAG: InlB B-repeat-containing protein [Lachnospiraceae bacterium]|nr:InlB B-repeat-containing protein [Lachnospiraceae bacterium]
MKKILAFILTLAMIVALMPCGVTKVNATGVKPAIINEQETSGRTTDYAEPLCTSGNSITEVKPVVLEIANGTSTAIIKQTINNNARTTIKLSNGETKTVNITPGYKDNTKTAKFSTWNEQFDAKCSTYDPSKKIGQTFTIYGIVTYEGYGEAEAPITINVAAVTVKSVDRVVIDVPNGVSLQQFAEYIKTPKVTVRLSNNTTITKNVLPIFQGKDYGTFYALYKAIYPGPTGTYDPTIVTAQQYELTGAIDLTEYGSVSNYQVTVVINVAAKAGKTVKTIEPVTIKFSNGVTLDAFKKELNAKHVTNIKLQDGTTVTLQVSPGRKSNTAFYSTFYEQYNAKYGNKGYDPNNKNSQSYTIEGIVDVSAYGGSKEAAVTINITVDKARTIKSIESVHIEMENGVSLDTFKAKLNETHKVKVTFSDNTSETLVVKPGYDKNGKQYATFYDQFAAEYNQTGYNPALTTEQQFSMYGSLDLSKYGNSSNTLISITIKVKARNEFTVTFDGNGGIYTGERIMKVKAGTAYGFKYDPANFAKEDYLFEGWYTKPVGGDRIWAGMICNNDITLYAHWRLVFCGKSWDLEAKSWKKGCLTVNWDIILTKVNGYEVAISTDKKNWDISVGPFSRVKYYTGLKSRKTYYIKVRGWRYDSTGKKIYGAWSTVISAKTK